MGNSCTIKMMVSTSEKSADLVVLQSNPLVWYPPDPGRPFIIDAPINIHVTRIVRRSPLSRPVETIWCVYNANLNTDTTSLKIGHEMVCANVGVDPTGQRYLISLTFSRHPSGFRK